MKKTTWLIIVGFIAILLYGTYETKFKLTDEETETFSEVEQLKEEKGWLQQQLEDLENKGMDDNDRADVLEDLLLDDLAGIESGNNLQIVNTFDPGPSIRMACIESNGQVFDGNGFDRCHSYGIYQWKTATLNEAYERYYNETLTNREAVMMALDNDKARELARLKIFDDEIKGGIYAWYNSNNALNLERIVYKVRELRE